MVPSILAEVERAGFDNLASRVYDSFGDYIRLA